MNSLKLHKIDHFTVVDEEDVQCEHTNVPCKVHVSWILHSFVCMSEYEYVHKFTSLSN